MNVINDRGDCPKRGSRIKNKHNKKLTKLAKELRVNMTDQERKLWYLFLKKYPIRFLRQKVIDRFIVDFYCNKAKLVIELDGNRHYLKENQLSDADRTKVLESYGLNVIRICNSDIHNNFDGVCDIIDMETKKRI